MIRLADAIFDSSFVCWITGSFGSGVSAVAAKSWDAVSYNRFLVLLIFILDEDFFGFSVINSPIFKYTGRF